MRIVGGTYKGRVLSAPGNRAVRPTTDRTREAVFNILVHGIDGFAISDCRVMDLFAGSGALGLEALSRGAKFVLFVEDSAAARGLVRSNTDALGVIGKCKIWRRDATRLGRCAPMPAFDLVFADPPYGKGFGSKALEALITHGWLNPGAVIVLEEDETSEIAVPGELELLDRRVYGGTQILFLRDKS